MVSIQFLGAAGTVTGSKHLLKTPEKQILIDCGLFQGIKPLRIKNWDPLPVNIREIDLVILTHAHLDHTGYIPLLVKSGYAGKIIMTPPTKDLTEIILRDSAKIQEEDAEKANQYGYTRHKPAKPLYTEEDAEKSLLQFEMLNDRTWYEVSKDIKFQFIKNGHILGSACIEMICHGKTIVFSGDIGRSNSELMDPPEVVEKADFLVMESTYGDRNHGELDAKDELADVINESISNKGNLLIPSFAVGRAQELMHLINELKKEVRIPDVPVYMDSPMGASATNTFVKYQSWHRLTPDQCKSVYFDINIISDFRDTLKVIDNPAQKIVIAASGMLTGGRVLEYLKNYLGDASNTILLVGYQTEGTRGRALRSGVPEIKLFGSFMKVKAAIREISTLSAHADQGEMLQWMKSFSKKPEKVYLVHGEQSVREAFMNKIYDEMKLNVVMPEEGDEHTLF